MYNNSFFFFLILSPLFLPRKNYLPDISSLITCFTWQPRQEDSSCFGKASGLQLCQMVSFCLPSISLSIALLLAFRAIEILLQEGRSLPGPESGLLPNTWKWIVWGDKCAEKILLGRGPNKDREQQGQWKVGGLLCHMAHSLGFYGDGINFWVFSGQLFCCRNQYSRNQAPHSDSWRTQVYYASRPRGFNIPSSESQTKGLQSFYRQTTVGNTSC